jgi:hypothetical protein
MTEAERIGFTTLPPYHITAARLAIAGEIANSSEASFWWSTPMGSPFQRHSQTLLPLMTFKGPKSSSSHQPGQKDHWIRKEEI